MKFVGYLYGIPVFSDPDCPPNSLYLMRKKQPKVDVSPSYSPSYSPSPSMEDDWCDDCCRNGQIINVEVNNRIDWFKAGFFFSSGVCALMVAGYWIAKLIEFLFK